MIPGPEPIDVNGQGTTPGLAGSTTDEKTHPSTHPPTTIKVRVIAFLRCFLDICLSILLASTISKGAMLIAIGILRVVYYITNQSAAFILVHACAPTRNEELKSSYVEICTYLLLFSLFSTIAGCAILSRKLFFHPTSAFWKNVFTSILGDGDARQSREEILILPLYIRINDLIFELVRVKQDKKGDEQDGAEGQGVEEAEEAEEEPASSIPERPPGAAGNHFSNNGAGSISNQNVGNVINTTFIFSESARLPVIS